VATAFDPSSVREALGGPLPDDGNGRLDRDRAAGRRGGAGAEPVARSVAAIERLARTLP
jgi:hypothetical protein